MEKCLWPDGAVSNFEKKVRLGQQVSPGCNLNKCLFVRLGQADQCNCFTHRNSPELCVHTFSPVTRTPVSSEKKFCFATKPSIYPSTCVCMKCCWFQPTPPINNIFSPAIFDIMFVRAWDLQAERSVGPSRVVWAECMHCPWALREERNGHFWIWVLNC